MTEAIRQIYWNVGEGFAPLALYLTAIAALAVMTWGILRDIGRWSRGKPDMRINQLPARLIEALSQVFGQKRVLKDRKPGSMHALIFFGFLALFIGTDIIAVEEDFSVPLIGPDAGRILVGTFYQSFEFILDTMGLVFLAGLIWAAWRRYRSKPDRLNNRATDLWVLSTLLYVTVTGYLIEGLRLANQSIGSFAVYDQVWAANSYVGYTLAALFRAIGLGGGGALALGLHGLFWYTHMLVTFAFIASIPLSKFKHIFYTPINTFFRDLDPKGALMPIPNLEAEIEQDEPALGVATLADFTWKQRLDFDACMQCGRCQSKCPAHASGSELSPKFLITKMADLMRGEPILLRDGSVRTIASLINGHDAAAQGAKEPRSQGDSALSPQSSVLSPGDAAALRARAVHRERAVELHHLPRLHGRMPGHDRACRPDRRPTPQPDHDPERGARRRQARAGRDRARRQPLAPTHARPQRLGRWLGRADTGREAAGRSALLGRLRAQLR